MKILVPNYYKGFSCIKGACRHSCCVGWEVDVDEESLERFLSLHDVAPFVEQGGDVPHLKLVQDERCPFLNEDGLCDMIIRHGEDILCDICRDHPRFRNFFTGRIEVGLGMVCEEAARLILSQTEPMELVELSSDGDPEELPEDEAWLLEVREKLFSCITEEGPRARLKEYLVLRHIADALYDDMLEERIEFVDRSLEEISAAWAQTDGSIEAISEVARAWSFAVEYDEEEKERRIKACAKQ